MYELTKQYMRFGHHLMISRHLERIDHPEVLLAVLDHYWDPVASTATVKLIDHHPDVAIRNMPKIVEVFKKVSYWQYKRNMAAAIAKLPESSGPLVAEVLKDKTIEEDARAGAAFCLGLMGEKALPFAKVLVDHGLTDAPMVAVDVAQALGKIGTKAAPIVATALSHENPDVRMWSAVALRLMGAKGYAKAIVDNVLSLDPKHEFARMEAIRALGSFGEESKPYVPLIVPNLNHGSWQVRQAAASALESLGDPTVIQQLEGALKAEEARVKEGFQPGPSVVESIRHAIELLKRAKKTD